MGKYSGKYYKMPDLKPSDLKRHLQDECAIRCNIAVISADVIENSIKWYKRNESSYGITLPCFDLKGINSLPRLRTSFQRNMLGIPTTYLSLDEWIYRDVDNVAIYVKDAENYDSVKKYIKDLLYLTDSSFIRLSSASFLVKVPLKNLLSFNYGEGDDVEILDASIFEQKWYPEFVDVLKEDLKQRLKRSSRYLGDSTITDVKINCIRKPDGDTVSEDNMPLFKFKFKIKRNNYSGETMCDYIYILLGFSKIQYIVYDMSLNFDDSCKSDIITIIIQPDIELYRSVVKEMLGG